MFVIPTIASVRAEKLLRRWQSRCRPEHWRLNPSVTSVNLRLFLYRIHRRLCPIYGRLGHIRALWGGDMVRAH